mgnify:CR=1 FL=1
MLWDSGNESTRGVALSLYSLIGNCEAEKTDHKSEKGPILLYLQDVTVIYHMKGGFTLEMSEEKAESVLRLLMDTLEARQQGARMA